MKVLFKILKRLLFFAPVLYILSINNLVYLLIDIYKYCMYGGLTKINNKQKVKEIEADITADNIEDHYFYKVRGEFIQKGYVLLYKKGGYFRVLIDPEHNIYDYSFKLKPLMLRYLGTDKM